MERSVQISTVEVARMILGPFQKPLQGYKSWVASISKIEWMLLIDGLGVGWGNTKKVVSLVDLDGVLHVFQ